MPKIIQPKRHDKSLNVDDYWQIRNEHKKNQSVRAVPPVYREN